MKREIRYSCGFCGMPCDENYNQLETIPDGYNPDDYPRCCCSDCYQEQEEKYIIISREMATDAQCPELEGEKWRW